MQADLIFPVLAVIAVTVFVAWRYDETVESAYNTFDYLRRIVGAIIVVLVAWTFLKSGSVYLYFIALLLIAFAVIWFMVERPDKDVV